MMKSFATATAPIETSGSREIGRGIVMRAIELPRTAASASTGKLKRTDEPERDVGAAEEGCGPA